MRQPVELFSLAEPTPVVRVHPGAPSFMAGGWQLYRPASSNLCASEFESLQAQQRRASYPEVAEHTHWLLYYVRDRRDP
jgi:hypothetical protein